MNSSVPGGRSRFILGSLPVVVTDRSLSQSLGWVVRMGDADWPQPHVLAIASWQVLAAESADDKILSCAMGMIDKIKWLPPFPWEIQV